MRLSLLLILLLVGGHLSLGQGMKKKAYFLGNEQDFKKANCALVPECDCCSAQLLLLIDNAFAIVDRCVSGDTYYTGTYSIKNNLLVLSFKQFVVNEEDTESSGSMIPRLKSFNLKDEAFKLVSCGNDLILENKGSFYKYGVGCDAKTELELRKELANSSSFDLLKSAKN